MEELRGKGLMSRLPFLRELSRGPAVVREHNKTCHGVREMRSDVSEKREVSKERRGRGREAHVEIKK
jgi:hypothetical protein